ncbi:MAG: trehalose-6-phosphate synthase [Hyphomonadaceae bacterium]|nr:trehalose-6-phosphate synthase [Hyphomonadaceae bacterium]
MGRVVLVSNRVLDLRKAAQAGGVAVALADIVRTSPSLWFGWNGDIKPAEDVNAIGREGRVATVALTQAEHDRYYLGYSNSVLWPVFHNRLDLAQFDAGYFEQYIGVNRRLAALLQPMLRPDDIIWVHDYQLIPLAMELRSLGVQNRVGFYLHIPFPPWQTFIAIPEHEQLARCLAAYDLIGLQTKSDVSSLIDYTLNSAFGSVLSDGRIRLFDRLVNVGAFPIGIDVAEFANPRRDSRLVQGRGVSRIVGVDRLDYTKGLPQKFRAFGRFLEKYPQYRRQVVLTQIAPPTRESVEAYLGIRQELESLAGSINGHFGELDWVPIHYIHRSTPRRRLPGLYLSSRIGMITPLRDGMNLVAKEYVAAQDPQDPGVLVLSRFAGAAEELQDALIVNPYDIEATADTIRTALEMSLDERQARHQALLALIKKNDVASWCQSFTAALARASSPDDPANWLQPEPIRNALEKLRRVAARRPASTRAAAAAVPPTLPRAG